MSVDKIRELLDLMAEHDLVELELEEGGDFKVKLKKPCAQMTAVPAAASMPPMPAQPQPAASSAPAAPPEDDPDLIPIKSPIVGTFYRSPSPDADPFVKEGDKVGKDSIVCIVEAMKIMNEVKAEVSGTIEKILIENGEAVEYGAPMFLVRP